MDFLTRNTVEIVELTKVVLLRRSVRRLKIALPYTPDASGKVGLRCFLGDLHSRQPREYAASAEADEAVADLSPERDTSLTVIADTVPS